MKEEEERGAGRKREGESRRGGMIEVGRGTTRNLLQPVYGLYYCLFCTDYGGLPTDNTESTGFRTHHHHGLSITTAVGPGGGSGGA